MQKDNIQSEFDLREIENIRDGLEKLLETKVTIELKEVWHQFDGEEESRLLGYGYTVETAEPVMFCTELASHLSISGLMAFWKGFSFAYYFGKSVQHEIDGIYDESATARIDDEDIPF